MQATQEKIGVGDGERAALAGRLSLRLSSHNHAVLTGNMLAPGEHQQTRVQR